MGAEKGAPDCPLEEILCLDAAEGLDLAVLPDPHAVVGLVRSVPVVATHAALAEKSCRTQYLSSTGEACADTDRLV